MSFLADWSFFFAGDAKSVFFPATFFGRVLEDKAETATAVDRVVRRRDAPFNKKSQK